MLRLVRFERSTNVERVALALAYKGIEVESVWVDPGDRSPVASSAARTWCRCSSTASGSSRTRPRSSSTSRPSSRSAAVSRRPGPARGGARLHRLVQPRLEGAADRIADALDAGRADPGAVARDGALLQAWLGLFEDLLAGREYLFGAFGVADCVAWPFLRYAAHLDPEDPWTFHRVLHEHMDLGAGHPRLGAWIERMAARPLA
jgi:glutathione S-transferase